MSTQMKMYLYSTAHIFFYHEHEKIDKENFKKAIFNQFDVCLKRTRR